MKGYKVRLLSSPDAEQYWSLRLEALQQNPEAFATSYEDAIKRKDPIGRLRRSLANAESFTFGAFNENKTLIGVVTLLLDNSLKMDHKASVVAMYVTPKVRCVGVGQSLLREVINKANSISKIEKLNLVVVTTNIGARRLYEKSGFKTFAVDECAVKVKDVYYDQEWMTLFLKR